MLHKEEHKSKFESQMHFLLSIFVIMTDITMIISYAVIVYVVSIKRNKIKRTTNKRKRLLVICLAIGATFIIFTLPFAVTRFTMGMIIFWANMILITNSGLISMIYFFRGRLGQSNQTRQKIQTNEFNYNETADQISNRSISY